MLRLEELAVSAHVTGIIPHAAVEIVQIRPYGSEAVELTYKTLGGQVASRLLYRDDEASLELVKEGRPWSLQGNGAEFRLAAEAHRIHLAHLSDPLLAVHSSNVEPLPHQITAVYEAMLPRQPLRFLLADDPGAGKTIMAGLLIKELITRGDLKRCLIVCPGSLAIQWQKELEERFDLRFSILTNEGIESSVTGNWFLENNLVISRLDKLARNEVIQDKLCIANNQYDLVVFDEAHKLSASYFGGEVKYTKRYHLGQRLSENTRHLLLMTATPHNGKEEDFQLFLALLDGDRFEGKPRTGTHPIDTSDMMRRMVKENLLKFDGTPLFPQRIAYTTPYSLSHEEALLYTEVTDYVRSEFNRAEALKNDKRAGTVGFALTILQRRLASSPEAIYQSLARRRQRLTQKLREAELLKRAQILPDAAEPTLDREDFEEMEDDGDPEMEQTGDQLVDLATAAQTVEELRLEIERLGQLERMAADLRRSGKDTKWTELSGIFHDNLSPAAIAEPRSPYGSGDIPPPTPSPNQKLVVFTEHRDTLNYLQSRIASLLGSPQSVRVIHGGMGREERAKAQESFLYHPDVRVLLATDAAGEGINLQRAHLMVNYDLPWNPNRLEQRFGRIHRIGQTEVCHLWNLVAKETREGEVYDRLLHKLEESRKSLGGQVFDVLGKLEFDGRSLRELLLEAIRYGDLPEVRARLTQKVENGVDSERIRQLLDDNSLLHDTMDTSRIEGIRRNMEEAQARKLQPFYIRQFFIEAFQRLGGSIHEREKERYEIRNVPAIIRNRDRIIGSGMPVNDKYDRVVFEKERIALKDKPLAAFITPGHPLMESVIELTREKIGSVLKTGTVLVDENDFSENPRMLFILEHDVRDASLLPSGEPRSISQRLLYVEIDGSGRAQSIKYAPYLDYRPLKKEEPTLEDLLSLPECAFVKTDLEQQALGHAIRHIVPEHLREVRERRQEWVKKTREAVTKRLTEAIAHWDNRAQLLREKEKAGKSPGKLNSTEANRRADELTDRLRRRNAQLDLEQQVTTATPVAVGGLLVVPLGLIWRMQGRPTAEIAEARDTQLSAAKARSAVMEAERALGFEPKDVEFEKKGYDIESLDPVSGHFRLIEVKGRVSGAESITVTKNEILTGLNAGDRFILALVEFQGEDGHRVHYVRRPFEDAGITHDFKGTSVNFPFNDFLKKSNHPS